MTSLLVALLVSACRNKLVSIGGRKRSMVLLHEFMINVTLSVPIANSLSKNGRQGECPPI
jgi:hypothetical protein